MCHFPGWLRCGLDMDKTLKDASKGRELNVAEI